MYVPVDKDGEITAKGTIDQKATITAISSVDNTLIATKEITIVPFFAIKVSSVTLSPKQAVIIEGKSYKFDVNISPSNADNKAINWSSSDETIAIVDTKGIVTGIKK